MKAEGFNYEPQDYVYATPEEASGFLDSADLSEVEYASKFGLAVSTLQSLAPASLSEEEENRLLEESRQQFESQYEGLDEAEQAAYERTFLGTEEKAGCRDLGYAALNERVSQYDSKLEDIRTAQALFATDERVEQFYNNWSECMASKGLSYSTPLGARDEFVALTEAVMLRGSSGSVAEVEAATNELEDLKRDEREIAVNLVECGASARQFLAPELTSIWDEYQEKFDI